VLEGVVERDSSGRERFRGRSTPAKLQRDRLGKNPIAQMRAQPAIAEHIDVAAEQIGEVLPKPDEVQQASARFHLDQKVNVAPAGHLPSSDRSEHAHVSRAVTGCAGDDFVTTLAQALKSCRRPCHHAHIVADSRLSMSFCSATLSIMKRTDIPRSGDAPGDYAVEDHCLHDSLVAHSDLSVTTMLKHYGERELTRTKFDEYFGGLPTDGEG
jgi:hypothetical protein